MIRWQSAGTWMAASSLAIAAAGMAWAQSKSSNAPVSDAAACAANLTPWLQYIASELRKIHLEVLEERREMQQARMKDLADELSAVQARQHQLQEEQQSRTLQVSAIEGELAKPSLSQEERAELEGQKAELLASPPPIVGSVQTMLAQQEAQARERLAIEEQRLQALEQQVRELSPGTN